MTGAKLTCSQADSHYRRLLLKRSLSHWIAGRRQRAESRQVIALKEALWKQARKLLEDV